MNASQSSNALKHESRSPFVRMLLNAYYVNLVQLVTDLSPRSIVDVGCGEGYIAEKIMRSIPGIPYYGLDKDPVAIKSAEKRLSNAHLVCCDAYSVEGNNGCADLVMCLEVLEHTSRPDSLLKKLESWTRKAVLITVPWEPYFRICNLLRGRHIARLGNHPDHKQQFSKRTVLRLVKSRLDVVQLRVVFPWLFVVALKRNTVLETTIESTKMNFAVLNVMKMPDSCESGQARWPIATCHGETRNI